MQTWLKFGCPAVVLCVSAAISSTHGKGDERSAANSPAIEQRGDGTAVSQNLIAYACPVMVMQVHEDYTTYWAHYCNPTLMGPTIVDSIHNSQLGTCGVNPDCVPVNYLAHGMRHTDKALQRDGLRHLAGPSDPLKLGAGTELLDDQLVDLVPESETPVAPSRIRLVLLKASNSTGDSSRRVVGSGHAVRRDPRITVPLLHISRDVEVLDDHCCVIRLGDVQYRVLLHRDSPPLSGPGR